jgi:antirestriction protein
MTKFYAQPYSMSATGFYFSSQEGFEQKSARNIDKGTGQVVEEYSFDFIDGSDINAKLWNALVGSQGFFDIEKWYDDIEPLDLDEKAKMFWLADNLNITDMDEALDKLDDVILFEGSAKDYAHDLIDDIGVEGVSNPDFYFDYESFGRDLAFDMDEDDEGDAYYLSLSNKERGEEFVDSMGGIKELGKQTAERYFDYDALVRDMELNGDIDEFDVAGRTFTVTNANSV